MPNQREIETWLGKDLCDYSRLELIEIVQQVCKERDNLFDYQSERILYLYEELKKLKDAENNNTGKLDKSAN